MDRIMVVNESGTELDYNAACGYMDDDIREELAGRYDTEQEFFSAYEAAHYAKYGEEWELSKKNPVW